MKCFIRQPYRNAYLQVGGSATLAAGNALAGNLLAHTFYHDGATVGRSGWLPALYATMTLITALPHQHPPDRDADGNTAGAPTPEHQWSQDKGPERG